jgi:hypothetical protein
MSPRRIIARPIAPALAALLAILFSASSGYGCAACFAASDPRTLRAYYFSTVLLSLMPLVLVAVLALFLRRRIRS